MLHLEQTISKHRSIIPKQVFNELKVSDVDFLFSSLDGLCWQGSCIIEVTDVWISLALQYEHLSPSWYSCLFDVSSKV